MHNYAKSAVGGMSDMPGMPETGKSENEVLHRPSAMNLTSALGAGTLSHMSQKGTENTFVSAATQLATDRPPEWESVLLIKRSDFGYILHAIGCGGAWRDTETAEWVDHTVERSFRELVKAEYSGHLSDDPLATWVDYADEFDVKPCLDHLDKRLPSLPPAPKTVADLIREK